MPDDPGELPGPATPQDPFKEDEPEAGPGGDWRAYCPACGEQTVDLPEGFEDVDQPWTAVQGRSLSYEERDYYCDDCRSFVNLKDPDVWHRGSRN